MMMFLAFVLVSVWAVLASIIALVAVACVLCRPIVIHVGALVPAPPWVKGGN